MNLPNQKDFYQSELNLDGHRAWKNFGGLTVDQAYEKFCENPNYYQEDFMFMGGPAFTFYFPIIDRYIREKEFRIAFSGETRILCEGFRIRIQERSRKPHMFTPKIGNKIVALCTFILDQLKAPSVMKTSEDMRKEFGSESWFEYTSLAAIKDVCTIIIAELEPGSN